MSSRTERACMVCGIIQPFRDFVGHGCPNCESLLPFKGDDSVVMDCTSPSFEGFVALCDQESSWVAKWLRIDGFQTGMYAVKVNGRLPEDVVRALTDKGIVYRPRDGSVQD
ncbi:Transcription elongation factor SPT4 [Wickerhamiella sorbophila]|uniref:Transcription elongation factor SPT4 n=1 Tax=Wickerhamiella sorbophila TaxID=45607 RepID=A0A2T0FIQ5_9ASCO|nr:Transcription elongation factor SPT4 [Wickerhamiella sorbophila]PRT54837.1 Transcription elongation factor SPT4 [Wickerhamiella sorbophila]